MDWDHFWGNAALPPGTVIIAQTAALERFRQPETAATLRDMAAREARFAGIELVAPTIGFSGSMRLEGGDLTLHLLHTPGHAPDHLAVWIPEIRTCLGVDAVEDPIPEVWSPVPGDLRALRASLQRIADLGAALLLPAHGGTSDPGLAARNLAYFDALAARVAGAGIGVDVGEADLAAQPGLRFEDCVPACRAMTAEMQAFYHGVHARNLMATLAAHHAAAERPST
jgi:glyoxylase-like metal-dependent hydrolase (beta-lactamase superfamily II)